MRNKIAVLVIITSVMLSAVSVNTYGNQNQELYNSNETEYSNNDSLEESTEGDNFSYDILDEMLEVIEKEEVKKNFENEGISLLWGNNDENEKNYGHYTSSNYAGVKLNLNSKDVEKLKIAATMPDNFTNPKSDFFSKENAAEAFHGRGNYIANSSYMWELAQELGKNSDKKSALAKVEKNATARYKSKLTAKDWSMLNELMGKMDGILATNMFPGTESDTNSRKLKVLGLTMHMVGDTCAHRTIVPADVITTIQNTKDFKGNSIDYKNYFSFASKTVSTSNLKLWMKNGTEDEYNNQMKANATWNVFQQAVKTGCMEFRDIKFFTKVSSVRTYEDNAYFYPVRYTITKNACVRLLNASSLSASRKIIIPRTHFIVFNNLKDYYVKAGGNIADFNYWKKISTDSFV